MTAKPASLDLEKARHRIDWASLAPLVTLLAIMVVFGFLATEFFSLGTISQTLKRGSVLAIVATGLTFVLLCAEIDLSVGTMALFSACVCGVIWAQPFAAGAREIQDQRKTALSLVDKRVTAERKRDAAIKEREALTDVSDKRREQIDKTIRESTEVIDKATAAIAQAPAGGTGAEFRSTAIAIAIPFLVALILGGVSGTLTVSSGLPSFIITLAMMYMANGLARFVTLSQKYDVPQFLKELGNAPLAKLSLFGRTLEIPQSAVLAAVVMLVAHVVLQHTRFGRYVYMTGGNRQAARLAGVRTERIVIGSLMICAVTAACGGMVNAGRLESVSLDQNADLLLEAVACVVLGGTSLFGGEGGIGRTAVGVFTFTILRVGLEATDPARLIKFSWLSQAWKQELLKMSWVTQFDLLRPFLLGIVLMLALVIHGRLVRKHHE
jgi:ribose/xylose/arabinose/galactoside ABC-type transport system permease subunit